MAVFIHGQTAVTDVATPVSADPIHPVTLIVKAFPDNLDPVYIGDSTVTDATGYPIAPGEEFRFDEAHGPLRRTPKLNEVYVIGVPETTVAWVATPR